MLSPKYLEQLPDNLIELYSKAESDIIADMARRLTTYDYFIPAAQWQYKKLREMSLLHEDILKKLSATTGISKKQIEQMIEQAGVQTLKTDDEIYKRAGKTPGPISASPELQAVLTAGVNKTQGLFENLTRTTANTATHQFEKALDRAYMQITSGAFDYNSAIRSAVKDLSQKGVAVVEYPSGHIDYMEVAVRRATVTGVNQTAAKLQEARADEMDSDLVEVTAHAGARPDHAEWQGKVFSRSGKHPKYPDFVSSTGYGTGAGLCGWNCRHNFYPFFEGISEKTCTRSELKELNALKYEYNGQKMTEYEATQKQRHIERQIRRWKREEQAFKTINFPTDEATAKVRQWQSVQRDFINQTGLKRQYDREQIPGGNKKKAERNTTEIKKPVSKNEKSSIIDTNKVKPKKDDANFENAFNKALEHGNKTGNECLLWLDLNGNEVIEFAAGNKNSVAISQETINYLLNAKKGTVISLHNHPKSSAFSAEDMNVACRFESVKEMQVVGHDGTKYYLEIGGGYRPDICQIRDAYNELQEKTHDKYYKMFIKTNDQVATWREHSNEINEAIAKKFKWTYRRENE
ncbi:MAG: phage minor capsid protein [Aminipila sp.]